MPRFNSWLDWFNKPIVIGTQSDDVLSLEGSDLPGKIFGLSGNDSMFGGNRDDYLFGGRGNDDISGGRGNDKIFGGAGNDTMSGGEGYDKLFGGGGVDTAVFEGSVFGYTWEHGWFHKLNVKDIDASDGDTAIDTLHGVEFLQFDDYTFEIGGNNGALVLGEDAATDEDTPIVISFDAYDFDGGTVTVSTVGTSAGSLALISSSALSKGMGVGASFSYSFDPTTAFNYLAVGEYGTATITIVIDDGQGNLTTHSLDISVAGVNDAPTITGVTNDIGDLFEDSVIAANGIVSATDPDASDVLTFSGGPGTYGTFSIGPSSGAWSYALHNASSAVQELGVGESLTDTIAVEVSDGNGGTDTVNVSVIIYGTNDEPVISTVSYDNDTVTEDGAVQSASGAVVASDVDKNDTLTYSVVGSSTGFYGTLALDPNTGTWSYVLDNTSAAVQALAAGQTVVETFDVLVSDGNGGFDTATISIDVNGTNDAPVITGTLYSIPEVTEDGGLSARGLITVTEIDANDTLSYVVLGSDTSGFGTLTVNPNGTWSYALNNDSELVQNLNGGETRVDTFLVAVTDPSGARDTTSISITINGADDVNPDTGDGGGGGGGEPPASSTLDFEGQLHAVSFEGGAGGVQWSSGWATFDSTLFGQLSPDRGGGQLDTGVANGATSGTMVVAGTSGVTVDGDFVDTFDFESAQITSALREGMTLTVEAFDQSFQNVETSPGVFEYIEVFTSLGSESFVLSTSGPTFVEFDDTIFDAVDRVVFTTSGGTPLPIPLSGDQFVMDDVTILI
ncbi:VCBS repeat-containing protein [Shimia sagamensis]|uniref:VCBS repeat-containing protein n=1 Tax=Shimia sagamensis TaxID=1566352 RepID=A0ABY1PKF0_9RHOB|nr:VCBS domain-containing protein [Shimia sagamensis]SMP35994.1 VCBS repeat-containing protein [Shimia sagamensis]